MGTVPLKQQAKVRGVIKWFSDAKGFGFITPVIRGEDVFVHFSAINGSGHRSLEEGDKVEYTVEQNDKGLRAIDVDVVT
jgi:CspA family cold shock protein